MNRFENKKLNWKDPRVMIGFSALMFAVALIDTMGLGANSFEEMRWWSKVATVLFCLPIVWWAGSFVYVLIKKIFKI